ncbi:MAG: UDP-2,4-diacetamido-2,4,6-trideoxy-beta-L-altropyranose hydrolase [Lachnospiraceae bacterium]|nr:UDP-2,4-diacetamido-2,4,6-trideoxy-beta-L-altropyranose hydrolase [Lachnospiraceae bacterium]
MLIIRADGNAKIGAGHLMRCLSIADAVRGLEILFLCADEDSAKLVHDRGYRAGVLNMVQSELEVNGDVKTGLEFGMEAELQSSMRGGWCAWDQWIQGSDHTILVDNYAVTDTYLEKLHRYGKVFLLDDMQQAAYPVDGVINYNVFADVELYRRLYAGRQTECYLGAQYTPLREQFWRAEYEIRPEVRQVLLTTGGGDVDNIAGQILDEIYVPEVIYHVLVGRFSPHFAKWQERMRLQPNVQVHYDVQDMAGMMRVCDLAVTAGGSTVYELAAVGVPFICFSYAENQEALVEHVGRTQTAASAGAWHRDRIGCIRRIKTFFEALREEYILRVQYFENERNMTDGKGAVRLARILEG